MITRTPYLLLFFVRVLVALICSCSFNPWSSSFRFGLRSPSYLLSWCPYGVSTNKKRSEALDENGYLQCKHVGFLTMMHVASCVVGRKKWVFQTVLYRILLIELNSSPGKISKDVHSMPVRQFGIAKTCCVVPEYASVGGFQIVDIFWYSRNIFCQFI